MMEASSFAVTLSIFFVRNTGCVSDASEVLLALPIEARSTITAKDMWKSLSTLGLDVKHLETIASGCTENVTVAHNCTVLDETAKLKRLLDIGAEQLVAVRSRHSELEALQDEISRLAAVVGTLQAEKLQLECDKTRIVSEISRLEQEDSLWGWRNPLEEQKTLFSDDDA